MSNIPQPEARSQIITRRGQLRELRPEEKLSQLDLENLNFEEALDKILATDEIREEIGEEWLDEYRQALMEDAGLGSKKFLDLVKWYNGKFPDNPVLIPSDYGISPAEVELPDWLIPGLVLRNGLTLFYGEAGSYKTILTIYMGYALMTGTDFFGITLDGSYKVIYVEQDESISILKDQVQKIGFAEDIFICCRLPVLWDGKEFNREFHNSLNALKPDVVFIDAYTSLGIEDIARPASALCLDALRRIANKYRISIIIIHHENLSGKQMGSSLHRAKIDSEIQTSVTSRDNNIEKVVLTQGKARGQHIEPIFIKADKNTLHIERQLNMNTARMVREMQSAGMNRQEILSRFRGREKEAARKALYRLSQRQDGT